MPRFFIVALLLCGVFFSWGVLTVRYHVFPWNWIDPLARDVSEFVRGDTSEKTGLVEKIANDLSLKPSRQLYDYSVDSQREYQKLEIPGLNDRRELPEIYVDEQSPPLQGFRFVFGTFDFESHLHGAILLDPQFRVVNTWVVDENAILEALEEAAKKGGKALKHKPPERRLPQGVVIFPDGSIIFNDGDRGNGMHRMDYCGNTQWTTLGYFHHSISYNSDDHSIWSFGPGDMLKMSPDTGELIRSLTLNEIHAANPGSSIFTVRRNMPTGRWQFDPIHKNDIEPLGKEIADNFSKFEAGDMVVSQRATNLLFVFDPDTLEIKWWRTGQSRRQHDPDWQPDGSITVFDNNMREEYSKNWDGYLPDAEERFSRIWRLDPENYSAIIIYDGKKDNMYSSERAKHQVLPNGNILISSAHQGRVLEITPDGQTVFEFLNTYDEKQNLILSEAIWLAPDFFDFDAAARNLRCTEN